MTTQNTRGVLCATAFAKPLGRVLRAQHIAGTTAAVRGWQDGAVAGGGTQRPDRDPIRRQPLQGRIGSRRGLGQAGWPTKNPRPQQSD